MNTPKKIEIQGRRRFFMNIPTGSVDTLENWLAEGYDPTTIGGLVEVTADGLPDDRDCFDFDEFDWREV